MIADNPKHYWLVLLFFPVVGIGCLCFSAISSWRMKEWVDAAKPVQAKIVEVVDRPTYKGRSRREVVLSGPSGKEFRVMSGVGQMKGLPEIGVEVEVLFNPESTDPARFNTFGALWGTQLFVGVMGMLFTTGGSHAVRQVWKVYREPASP